MANKWESVQVVLAFWASLILVQRLNKWESEELDSNSSWEVPII